jgi:hypothetical protein
VPPRAGTRLARTVPTLDSQLEFQPRCATSNVWRLAPVGAHRASQAGTAETARCRRNRASRHRRGHGPGPRSRCRPVCHEHQRALNALASSQGTVRYRASRARRKRANPPLPTGFGTGSEEVGRGSVTVSSIPGNLALDHRARAPGASRTCRDPSVSASTSAVDAGKSLESGENSKPALGAFPVFAQAVWTFLKPWSSISRTNARFGW